jgi:hypothetical protein
MIDGKEQWFCKWTEEPYCDSSHNLAKGEEPGKLYWYDEAGKRHEVADQFPGIRFLESPWGGVRRRY